MNQPILLVCPVLPWPPDQGNKQFMLDVARGLSSLGEVTILSRELPQDQGAMAALEAEGFSLLLDQSFLSQNPVRKVFRRLSTDWRALRSGRPRELAFVSSPEIRRLASRFHHQNPGAMGIGAYWTTWRALEDFPRENRVLVLADIDHQAAAAGRAIGDGSRAMAEVEGLRRAELEAFHSVSTLLCLTPEDRVRAEESLAEEGSGATPRCELWPVAYPVESAPPRVAIPGERLRFFCHGHWQAAFNRDGLGWFLQEIWPEDAGDLRLAGCSLEEALGADLPAGVEVVGWVPELAPEFARCEALIIPLRYAGGLRYRLLEAFAAGRPVVCTEVAAAGSGAVAGEHFLPFHDRTSFLGACQQLRAGEGARIAEAAFEFLQEYYGRDGRTKRLQAVLNPAYRGHDVS